MEEKLRLDQLDLTNLTFFALWEVIRSYIQLSTKVDIPVHITH